ncbi:molybdopterin-synthase adenylyltransferase MoeB [bacterium]|nr:molybdopterin-synthase adenylyltransferase MoeB [bacterium]
MSPHPLSGKERIRYSRHLVLPQVGREGQERLAESSALVVGVGGLGSPVALYLAAAGVGRIGLVDFDTVSLSNLQRQVLFTEKDLGLLKVDVAKKRLLSLNSDIKIETFPTRLEAKNGMEVLEGWDVVLDGADNFPTRYLVNDLSVLLGIPNVHASLWRFEGQLSLFGGEGPCYRCLFPTPPPRGTVPSCAEGGVLGVLPGIMGSLQAAEGIKVLLGIGKPLGGRLLLVDVLSMKTKEMRVERDKNCPLCGESPSMTEPMDTEAFCGMLPEEEVGSVRTLSPLRAKEMIEEGALLLDVRQKVEVRAWRIPGSFWIPMDELPDHLDRLDPLKTIVVHCHQGPRSRSAAALLVEAGFQDVFILDGGLDAWAQEGYKTL